MFSFFSSRSRSLNLELKALHPRLAFAKEERFNTADKLMVAECAFCYRTLPSAVMTTSTLGNEEWSALLRDSSIAFQISKC